MSAFQPISLRHRELVEIDALMRALRDLRHWSATAADREGFRDDIGRRLHTSAAGLREEAWVDSLHAACRLFEVDTLDDAWRDIRGGTR